MHILLTRPLDDCKEMIIKFSNLGHQVSHLPLLNIEPVDYDHTSLKSCKGIIFTSANAIKHLNYKNLDKNCLCFCVGLATEKKSKKLWISKCNFSRRQCKEFKRINFKKF